MDTGGWMGRKRWLQVGPHSPAGTTGRDPVGIHLTIHAGPSSSTSRSSSLSPADRPIAPISISPFLRARTSSLVQPGLEGMEARSGSETNGDGFLGDVARWKDVGRNGDFSNGSTGGRTSKMVGLGIVGKAGASTPPPGPPRRSFAQSEIVTSLSGLR
jgi:hypothetical protein